MNAASLDPGLEQTVIGVLNAQPAIRLAILFGSLAAGKVRADSDIDLAVDGGRRLTAEEKMTLIAGLAAATGRPVDLVDLRAAGEPLLGQILKHGKRILGSDAAYAAVITRHLFDQADFLPYRNRILAERRRAWIGK
jgi:predicted nucleotidyltransferase